MAPYCCGLAVPEPNISQRAPAGVTVGRYAPFTCGNPPQPPKRIKPQLTRLVDEAPMGDDWLHEMVTSPDTR
jgi:hypothetical protein